MPKPLSGIRVLDFSHFMAGPFATFNLSLLGAEVVKVESSAGDGFRGYGKNDPYGEMGMGFAFIGANAGKKSIVLDLKSDAGMDVARRLIAESDVVVENFRPGIADRLGIGYESCKTIREDIVYCSISGYGQTGPMRDYPAIDNVIQATSGMMSVSGDEGSPPMRIGIPAVDTFTGSLTAYAILAALMQRERFGTGQRIDMALMDASLVLMTGVAMQALVKGEVARKQGNVGLSGQATAAAYTCRDGRLISLGAIRNHHFAILCEEMRRPELSDDERFANPPGRVANTEALAAILTEELAKRDAEEWETILSRRGVPCGMVRTVAEALELPQLNERNLKVPMHVDGLPREDFHILNAGFEFEHDGPEVAGLPPRLGEHTQEVLRALGYSEAEIERMIAEGAASPQRNPS